MQCVRIAHRHWSNRPSLLVLCAGLVSIAVNSSLAQDTKATAGKKSEKQAQADKKESEQDTTQQRLNVIENKLDALVQQLKAFIQPDTSAKNEEAQPTEQTGSPKEAVNSTETDGQRQDQADNRQDEPPLNLKLDEAWLDSVPWRSIGPANMGGRVTDLVIHQQDPSLWWIATASGGLLKTSNQGVTVEHQFDEAGTVSIGCIAADPNDKKVIWVGTGEANPRNSVSYGDGVYKSTDGGKTFKNMGLRKTFQIGRILVHPQDGNVVYVGALGRLYGPNRERGVFKTTDGGKTWEHVLYVDDNSGVIDMIMHPTDPDTIIAAMWDRMRDGFDSWPGSEEKPEGIDGYDPIRKWGPGGGLYKTTNGGQTWKKLSEGLPSGMTGRIGLDWQSKSPHTIYAIIDCADIGKGPKPSTAFFGAVGADLDDKPVIVQLLPDSPAEKAGLKTGDVLIKADGSEIEHFDQLLDILREKKVGTRLQLELTRDDQPVNLSAKLTGRPGTDQEDAAVWLGVQGTDRDENVTVTRVISGGPADKAGLKTGDIIEKVNAESPEDYQKLISQISEQAVGDKVQLEVRRGAESLNVEVTLELRPARGGQRARSNSYMGIQGENAESGGANLTSITNGGPSEKAGLKSGDIVKKVDGKDIADYNALISEIRSREPNVKMKVTVMRGGKSLDVDVTLGDRRGRSAQTRPYTYSYFGQRPNIQDQQGAKGYEYGGIYKSEDAGETWRRVNSLNTRPMYFSVVKVDPSDDQRVYVLGVSQFRSSNGGRTFTSDFGRGVHADGHDLWIDPEDGRHMVIGGDGGFYVTYDYGDNWDHINTAAVGQFYHVTISPKEPYWVVGGLQDNGSWAGPAISRSGGAINEDFISVGGGDGFVCRVDPNEPDLVYYESQNGNMSRRNLKTGERSSIRPRRVEGERYRFNWNTPFILSSHNSKIFYCAGNFVFRSLDRGNNLRKISPEITLTKRGSATAVAESPRDPNVLYAGTDDGALWVTRDGGTNWKNITEHLNTPAPRWVATIEASRFADGRVYVCLDGHRSDDDNPYVFVSEDYGESFEPLHKGIPWGSTRCLREDIRNENLLYLGTEFAFWVSVDRGRNWTQFNQKLPTVAVHEVAIHPTNGEIVLATHGRSLWACDVTGLRELKPEHLTESIALHDPHDVTRWRTAPRRGRTNRRYVAENPPRGAQLWYSLPEKADRVRLRIENIEGQRISELSGKIEPGLHRIAWNLTRNVAQRRNNTSSNAARTSDSNRAATRDQGAQGRTRQRRTQDPPAEQPATRASAEESTSQADAKKPPETTKDAAKDPPNSTEPTDTAEKNVTESPASPDRPSRATRDARQSGSSTQPPAQTSATRQAGTASSSRPAPSAGFRGTGTGRPVPNGTYRVTLVVDGRDVQSQTVTLQQDPSLPADAIADEVYEEMLLKDLVAEQSKSQAKTDGRDVWRDD